MDTSVKECLSKSKFRDSQKYIILLHDDKPKINDAPAGSILMFSIIGYTLLLKNGIPDENIYFSQLIDYKSNDYQYFAFDDFSYSGSQLNQTLNKVYFGLLLDESASIQFNVILCGVTSMSIKKIQEINNDDESFKILKDKYPTRLNKVRTIYHF